MKSVAGLGAFGATDTIFAYVVTLNTILPPNDNLLSLAVSSLATPPFDAVAVTTIAGSGASGTAPAPIGITETFGFSLAPGNLSAVLLYASSSTQVNFLNGTLQDGASANGMVISSVSSLSPGLPLPPTMLGSASLFGIMGVSRLRRPRVA